MYFVYVLKSQKDNNLYIGCTSDLEKRLVQHNSGFVRSTKSRRPFTLIYKENFVDKYEAFKIEKFYKTPVGKKVLKSKLPDRLMVGHGPLKPVI